MSSANKVKAVYFFQMDCPACAARALPQACDVAARFPQVEVLGVHPAADARALKQYLRENDAHFAVAISDAAFTRYSIQGTPSLALFDRAGALRRRFTGVPPDLMLGAELMALVLS
jgi:thiol-disulfide isomerase/thioredoxin